MTPTPAKYFQSARSIFTPKCFRAMSIRGNEATKHRRQPSRGRAHRQRSASPHVHAPQKKKVTNRSRNARLFLQQLHRNAPLQNTAVFQRISSGWTHGTASGIFLCREQTHGATQRKKRTGAAGAPARLKFMGTRLSAAGDQAPATAASSSCRMVPRPSTSPSILVYRSCTPCRFRISS